MQFSIKTLFVLTTVVAIGSCAYLIFGASAIWLLVWGYVVSTGAISHHNEKATPFWGCIASVLILAYLFSQPGKSIANTEAAIAFVLAFTLGGYLAYSGIQHGHEATKLFGSLILAAYITVFLFVLGGA